LASAHVAFDPIEIKGPQIDFDRGFFTQEPSITADHDQVEVI
jgi:hypothetical protein